MASTTPANLSHLEKSPCSSKYDAGYHEPQPEKHKQDMFTLEICSEEEVFQGDQPPKPSKVGALQTVAGSSRRDAEDESGRERLKRHRMEMGGRVWIPDTWGQENLLKNWIDCTAFDASLGNSSVLSARAALMQQRATTRSANNLPLRRRILENRC
ncbi:hypothetical protein DCAR_0310360 [Daucus carota subsp. sativus]|uniref:Protein BIC1 n=1 Tax=Daucus carota subsp. sativus TaxID=79200 RepID=A0A165ZTK4_DAUCS|nr:PREDICTED: uncharacterized protein LOC108215004 [Daucus carota subsp. sativus]WOG91112.1 hypothetical protein DCAR_0310360 [Daucus carota subsp. sativus]